MAKYVKCIDDRDLKSFIKEGNTYRILEDVRNKYKIIDDYGSKNYFNKWLFEEPYELPEPITFASQEDFENAVMEVVIKRLNVCDYSKDGRIYFDVEDAFKEGKQ